MKEKNPKEKTTAIKIGPLQIAKAKEPFVVEDEGIEIKVLDKATLKKIKKANDKPRPKDDEANAKNTGNFIVEVENVQKTYLSGNIATEVLKGITFQIERGEIAILYGKSGSGKSTLLNIISCLDRATSGKVVVNNVSLPYLSDRKQTLFRRENTSFIFQNYNLLQNLNSYDNVETGAYLQADKSKRMNIKKLFEDFELKECMYKYPSQMSGGQQQRVSILRAIAKNSEIIIADEPTGALDEKTSKIVLKILQQINRDHKSTVIIVSHDPDVAELADKVIYLENGKIKNIIKQTRKSLID
ncbi:ABC transporter ATP-binding protein [Metamycoplasma arthritidis]|uniref:ABC transporter ATP-binding protein n=1 Tax=Metamycoplasma arthritidis (strain 158L3-1) TaxID=243272 RepID=B3PM05_META1|nr:ABC transporter ATP-binding protein [Metamycoplasma arthritidis]ACF07057.1 ABC transporter ATP-binding protein [Metamycoplasma arthritidis 158L3-1]VEU78585.1 ABC transporter ATP-binding protein [Metamycoplasma arthritidis]